MPEKEGKLFEDEAEKSTDAVEEVSNEVDKNVKEEDAVGLYKNINNKTYDMRARKAENGAKNIRGG